MTQKGRVSPFGDPRIKGCSPLPAAFRSVPRPSSPLSAKASTKCPYALDPKLFRRTQRADPPCPTSSLNLYSALHVTRLAVEHRSPVLARKPKGPARSGNRRQRPVAFFSTMSNNPCGPTRPHDAGPNRARVRLETSPRNLAGSGSRRRTWPALVEPTGIEPVTPCLQSRCSPS
jgi:hypothetical protein